MSRCGVDRYIVSSTATCTDDYSEVLSHILRLISLDGSKVIPCLWLTENGLSESTLEMLLTAGIRWRCLKIHPYLRPWEWQPREDAIYQLVKLSKTMGNIPVLIHTGFDQSCNSKRYEQVISQNPDISFILAHSRPLDEAAYMVRKYSNVYVDTAFVNIKDIQRMVQYISLSQILWGTDLCIPYVFVRKMDLVQYYRRELKSLLKKVGLEAFKRITYENAERLFRMDN